MTSKKQILQYLTKNRKVYASKISEDLDIDIEQVFAVLNELKDEGKIKWQE